MKKYLKKHLGLPEDLATLLCLAKKRGLTASDLRWVLWYFEYFDVRLEEEDECYCGTSYWKYLILRLPDGRTLRIRNYCTGLDWSTLEVLQNESEEVEK